MDVKPNLRNIDQAVVSGFGDEWSRFDQSALSSTDRWRIWSDYFSIFSWETLPTDAIGVDIGCGTGRWAALVAPKVGKLLCVDASPDALAVARRNLHQHENVEFQVASVDNLPVPDNSQDFVYSLGVLHHVPDTPAAVRSIVAKLKPGAPILLYLYYNFENRPSWFRALWHLSEFVRRILSHAPHSLTFTATNLIALGVYWPLARLAKSAERCGASVESWPLAYYRDKGLYVMQTDARDRFGTRLEQRFSRRDISNMLTTAGCVDIVFSERPPFWVAAARRST
ncbi:class I SAM-dependent methyltransferase [Rhodopseudomonas palustris]|uniref:class I SAM-dependent methyltransferase n=1 Tax=Rhodopseudomonas palustris TaxID=1076 RepID=UPI0022EFF0D3|nr:class I SAM-dependent methyltransferase [Rhodopseudomonas palustris]WBU31258.1 class I SAM-dependent methyltransferase [Rhodopseudomonas palustris]